MDIMACLVDIVGVTDSDCACITGNMSDLQKAELKKSASGLFMDNVPGGVHMKALKDVDTCKAFYDMAIGARDTAIHTMQGDLVVAMNNKYKKDKVAFVGQIGRMSYAQTLGISHPIQGMRIRPYEYSDAVLNISRINIILNAAVTLTVKIWRIPLDYNAGDLIKSFPVTTAANGYTPVPGSAGDFPIVLPFVYNNMPVEYWITYDTAEPGTPVAPKDTTLICNSCPKGGHPYSQYVNVYGVQMDNYNNFLSPLFDAFSHGLILDADIRCSNEQLFCREYKDDDAVAITMAYATQFKASELLIEEVLKSPDVNRYTTMAREYLWGKRNHFRAEYDARVTYLALVIDVTVSNCYVCRETKNQPFIQGILS